MSEPGGAAWRQTTFFPFSVTSRLARGEVLRPAVCTGSYDTAAHGTADVVDAVATHDEATGASAVFLVNRSLTDTETVRIDVRDLGARAVQEALSLFDDDVYAKNTLAEPERVGLRANTTATLADGVLTVELPPVSWTAVALG